MKINNISQQYNNKTASLKRDKNMPALNSTPAFKGAQTDAVVNGLKHFAEGTKQGLDVNKLVSSSEVLTNATGKLKAFATDTKSNGLKSLKGTAFNQMTKLYTKAANSNVFKKIASTVAKSDNGFLHLMVAESAWLSGFYMFNTLRNKKIDKEQKPQMLVNDALVWGVSTAGTYLVDGRIKNGIDKMAKNHLIKNDAFYTQLGEKAKEASQSELSKKVRELLEKGKDQFDDGFKKISETISTHLEGNVNEKELTNITNKVKKSIKSGLEKSADKEDILNAVKNNVDDAYNIIAQKAKTAQTERLKTGVNKIRGIVVAGLLYRFFGPVIVTPIANKISKKITEKKKED